MIYSVVPRELETELFDRLTERYADEPEVTVIVDRRHSERRSRSAPPDGEQRVLRDRRRRRVTGEFAALEGEGAQPTAA